MIRLLLKMWLRSLDTTTFADQPANQEFRKVSIPVRIDIPAQKYVGEIAMEVHNVFFLDWFFCWKLHVQRLIVFNGFEFFLCRELVA